MQGASRVAMHASREALAAALQGAADGGAVGEEILAMSSAITGNVALRRALSDPARQGADKAALVTRVFTGKVGTPAKQVVETVVAQRWRTAADLGVALELLAVEALLAGAESHGRLGQVEDELFRFHRIVTGTSQLRAAVTERRAPVASRKALVRDLLSERAAPETVRLAEQAVSGSRLGRFDHAVETYLDIAQERQDQVTATVTAAVPLSEEQRERLVRALSQQLGRAVHANVIVDPEVIGGLRVEIGDEVIDGTIASRLDQARRQLTG